MNEIELRERVSKMKEELREALEISNQTQRSEDFKKSDALRRGLMPLTRKLLELHLEKVPPLCYGQPVNIYESYDFRSSLKDHYFPLL